MPHNAADPFVELSTATWMGLNDAVRESGWIADGGDPSAPQSDRDMANLKQTEYDREQVRVMQRLLAYLAKRLTIQPPSDQDVAKAKDVAATLANMRDVNVKVAAILNAANGLLEIYNRT